MNTSNIKSGWKTTLTGLIIIFAALASVFIKGVAWSTLTVPLLIGILLMLAPDTLVVQIRAFLKSKSGADDETPGEPPTIPPAP